MVQDYRGNQSGCPCLFSSMAGEQARGARLPKFPPDSDSRLHEYMVIAKSFVLLILLWCREVPLHCERRRAVESSFRGPPATFSTHEPFGQETFGSSHELEGHNEP